MTLRKFLLALGAILAAVTLLLPTEFAAVVQVLAGIAFAVHLCMFALARLSTSNIINGLRILCGLLAGMWAFAISTDRYLGQSEKVLFWCMTLGFGVIAIGPYIPRSPRIYLYLGVVLMVAAAMFTRMSMERNGGFVDYLQLVIGSVVVIHGILNWAGTGAPSFEQVLVRSQIKARNFMRVLGEEVSFDDRVQGKRLEKELRKLAGSSVPDQERYARLQQLCAEYPKSVLAWRMALAAAWRRNDHHRTRQLILELERSGMAKEIGLSSNANDLRAQLQATRDRTEAWLREDKVFAELQGI